MMYDTFHNQLFFLSLSIFALQRYTRTKEKQNVIRHLIILTRKCVYVLQGNLVCIDVCTCLSDRRTTLVTQPSLFLSVFRALNNV